MRSRLVTLALAALLLVAMAACGGDNDDEPAASGSTTSTRDNADRDDESDGGNGAEPARWTRELCTELASWQDELERLATDLETQLEGVSDPEGARERLVRFIDDAVAATDEMLEGVEALGAPDVDDGDAIAREIESGLDDLRQVFIDGRERAEQLPVDDPTAFSAGATELGEDLRTAGQEIQENFEALDSEYNAPELNRAFDGEPACQRITS